MLVDQALEVVEGANEACSAFCQPRADAPCEVDLGKADDEHGLPAEHALSRSAVNTTGVPVNGSEPDE